MTSQMVSRITLALIVTVAMLLGQAAAPAHADAPSVTLARDGRPTLAIVVVDPQGRLDAFPHTEPSLADLGRTLEQMTEAAFELRKVAALPAVAEPAIYVGVADDLQTLGAPQDLATQECLIRTTADGSLLLTGGDAHGVSHAIYTFLHEVGCRWYYPGDAWTVVPERPTLAVSLEHRASPDFPLLRRIWLGWGMATPTIREDFTDWRRRNRTAQPAAGVETHHTWFGLDVPDGETRADRQRVFQENPEWFALYRGERNHRKPCYSHPEVIQHAVAYALDYFEQNPDQQMVSVSPPDGGNYCGCERCLSVAGVVETWDGQHNTIMGRNAEGVEVSVTSETLFRFTNAVARAVDEAYPGKQVGMLAYTTYAHPPSFEFEPNVFVEITAGYRFTPLSMADQIESFSAKARWLGIYQYYDVLQWSWERPGRASASRLDVLQERLRMYHDNGIRALSSEMSNNFGPNGVGYYVIVRLLWDVNDEARAIEEELYRDAFGPAAPAVRRVYRRWESERWSWDTAEPLDMLQATYRDLHEAAELTEGQPAYRQRVDLLRMYAHFLKEYVPMRVGRNEDDVRIWQERYGHEQTPQRIAALAEWGRRLMNTHMVHSSPFNMYLAQRADLLGLDTSDWRRQPLDIPTTEQIDAIFKQDMATLIERQASTMELIGHPADYTVRRLADEGAVAVQDREAGNLRLGQFLAGRAGNTVYVFELPVLPEGRAITEANLTARVTVSYDAQPDAGPLYVDLWGIGFQANTEPILRYLHGDADPHPSSVQLQRGLMRELVPNGAWVRTDEQGGSALAQYLQSFYDEHPDYQGGWYVFLRMNPNVDPNAADGRTGYVMRSADTDHGPRLMLFTSKTE